MMKRLKNPSGWLLSLLLALALLSGCGGQVGSPSGSEDYTSPPAQSAVIGSTSQEQASLLDIDGVYDSAEDVALYLYTYGELPCNFITKAEAKDLGWSGGSVEQYAPGMCIGGDRFGNYEGLLPKVKGRSYYECDIDTLGEDSRGAKRLVYSNDGLIYYTPDHYESFELLYGDEADAAA